MGAKVKKARILIADYSTDGSEADLIGEWLPSSVDAVPVLACLGDRLPDPSSCEGIIHTGSSYSICAPAPFDAEAERLVRTAAELAVPQMGVCYGHQLLCRALVGREAIRPSPRGLEAGWRSVRLSPSFADALGVDRIIRVLQMHFDEVTSLPEDGRVVGSSDHSSVVCFECASPPLLGVQFHPEFGLRTGNELFERESALLREHGYDPENVKLGGPSIDSGRVFFGYFIEHYIHAPLGTEVV